MAIRVGGRGVKHLCREARLLLASPPTNNALPQINGTPRAGYTLTLTQGDYNNSPVITDQWTSNSAPVNGATGGTYALTSADVGKTISVTETATNTGGVDTEVANNVGPIQAAIAPSNTAVPVLSYDTSAGLVPGVTVYLSDGAWSGDPPPTFSYQITSNGGGAAANSYVVQNSDVGFNIGGSVTATNIGDSATANAVAIGPVSASTGLDTSIAAPTLTVTTANNVWPPALSIVPPPDFKTDVHTIRLQCSTDPAFGTTVFNDPITLSDAQANAKAVIDSSLASLASGIHYFRAWVEWNSGANHSLWSTVVGHGDSTAPTISTTASNPVYDGNPLSLALTANKTCTWAITGGEDMSQFQIDGTTLAWRNDGTRSHGSGYDAYANDTYNVTLVATDYFGNTATLNETITVSAVGTPSFGTGFTPVANAPLSTLETSNAVVPTGMTASVNYTSQVSANGSYRVSTDGGTTWGSWTAGSSTATFNFQSGWAIQVRQTSSGSYATETDVTVTIGSTLTTFAVTTQVAPGTAGVSGPHLAGTGTTSVSLASVSFLTGYRVIHTVGQNNATSVSGSVSGSFTKITITSNSTKHDLWISSASAAAGTETITCSWAAGTTWSAAAAFTAVNIASATPAATSFRALTSNLDPKLFGSSMAVPSLGIGFAAVRGSGSPSSITFNNGTKLGQEPANGATALVGYGTIPANTTETISFGTGVNNFADGVAVAWSQA